MGFVFRWDGAQVKWIVAQVNNCPLHDQRGGKKYTLHEVGRSNSLIDRLTVSSYPLEESVVSESEELWMVVGVTDVPVV